MTHDPAVTWSRRRFLGGAVSLAALASVTAACGSSAGSSTSGDASLSGSPSGPAISTGGGIAAGVDAELIGRRYAGLAPFAEAPPAPQVKPVTLSADRPSVFSRVPITDKVVFVTIDDGAEKEPAFVRMVEDFRIPLTLCLADTFIKDDYAYFERLYRTGYVSIQNHTLTHPLNMPRLSPARQLEEIAGQQEKLRARYGTTARIFRPPGGNYDATTVRAVREGGLGGVMLWKEAMQIQDLQYRSARHALGPGDIILCHFRGPAQLKGATMVQMMTALYRKIQDQGFTVADITRYV